MFSIMFQNYLYLLPQVSDIPGKCPQFWINPLLILYLYPQYIAPFLPFLSPLQVASGSSLGTRRGSNQVLYIMCYRCSAGFLSVPLPPSFILIILLITFRGLTLLILPLCFLDVPITLTWFLVPQLCFKVLTNSPLVLFRTSALLLLSGFLLHFPSEFL